MNAIEPLGNTLILYKDLLEHLRSKGKGKNWFDTIRTRYGMRHEPIIKPYDKLISSGRKSRAHEQRRHRLRRTGTCRRPRPRLGLLAIVDAEAG